MDPILFHPDSRWLASNPAGDFGMFGAQPIYSIQPSRTPSEDVERETEGAAAPDVTPHLTGGPATAAPEAPVPESDAPQSTLTPVASIAPTPTDLSPVSTDPLPQAAASTLTPVPLATTDPRPDADLATASALVAPVIAASPAPAQPALTTPIAELAPTPIEPTLADHVADVTALAEPAEGLPLDALLAAPAMVVGAVGDTLAGLPVQDLLGVDPVGGIATLINLVTVADVIDLKDAGAPADGSLAGLGTPLDNLLDTLTAEPITLPEIVDDGDGGLDLAGSILPDLPDLPQPPPLPDLGLGI